MGCFTKYREICSKLKGVPLLFDFVFFNFFLGNFFVIDYAVVFDGRRFAPPLDKPIFVYFLENLRKIHRRTFTGFSGFT